MTNEQLIMKKLDELKVELDFIKEHMVDVDTILTAEEAKRLDESLEAYKKANVVSLDELKKQLGR